MPDCDQCIPPDLLAAQQRLTTIAAELRLLDQRLEAVGLSIEPHPEHLLSAELPSAIEAIRTDVLGDAIRDLESLAVRTEDAVRADLVAATDLLERLGHGG